MENPVGSPGGRGFVTGKQTEEAKTYVATDPDSLADTLKLAMVSRAMNAAR